jgi:hypothetical protein
LIGDSIKGGFSRLVKLTVGAYRLKFLYECTVTPTLSPANTFSNAIASRLHSLFGQLGHL